MTLTIDIRPEVQAELARQASATGMGLGDYASNLLEQAAHLSAPPPVEADQRRTGQALIDAFEDIRGLLSNEEIDQMFTRNRSGARQVDLS